MEVGDPEHGDRGRSIVARIHHEMCREARGSASIQARTNNIFQEVDRCTSLRSEASCHRVAGVDHQENMKWEILVGGETGEGRNQLIILVNRNPCGLQVWNDGAILGSKRK